MSEWHIQDVGTVSADTPEHGVRLHNIGFDLDIAPSEARQLAKALNAAAAAIDALAGRDLAYQRDLAGCGELDDGFGNVWQLCKPGCQLQIVRPGKVQCECETA